MDLVSSATVTCLLCGSSTPAVDERCRSCGSSFAPPATSEAALSSGTQLRGGRYRIEKVLGRGGFGITYKATDLVTGAAVAVKELFPSGRAHRSSDGSVVAVTGAVRELEAFRRRLTFEAGVLRGLRHPSLVAVLGTFEERGTAYLVMEYLAGETLEARILRGRLGEAEARALLAPLLEALGEVHAVGLLHLDVKPANIVLTHGRPELVDFGSAARFASGQTTRLSSRLLTPAYASLEQYASSARLGPQTDFYALAATFYEALTGVPPAPSLERANGRTLEPIRRLNPGVSPEFSSAIERALELRVDRRPRSVLEFLPNPTSVGPTIQAPQPVVQPKAPNYTSVGCVAAAVPLFIALLALVFAPALRSVELSFPSTSRAVPSPSRSSPASTAFQLMDCPAMRDSLGFRYKSDAEWLEFIYARRASLPHPSDPLFNDLCHYKSTSPQNYTVPVR